MKGSTVIAAALLSTLAIASPQACAPANTVTITQIVTSTIAPNNAIPAAGGQGADPAVAAPVVVTVTETQGGVAAVAAPSVVAVPAAVENAPMSSSVDAPADNVPVTGSVDAPDDNVPVTGSVDGPVAQNTPAAAVSNIAISSPTTTSVSDPPIVEPPNANDDTFAAGTPAVVLETVTKVVTTIIDDGIGGSPKTLMVTKTETQTSHRVIPVHRPTDNTDSKASPTHYVAVGQNGKMTFEPPFVNANGGQTVRFRFFPRNHTVTSSEFDTPCEKSGNFDSGFKPTFAGNSSTFADFEVPPNTDKPMWFHSQQKGECKQGMVFAINPESEKQYHRFVENAKGGTKNRTNPKFGGFNETRIRNGTAPYPTSILSGLAILNATTTYSTSSSTSSSTDYISLNDTAQASLSNTTQASSSTTAYASFSNTTQASSSTTDHVSSSTSQITTSTSAQNARGQILARSHSRRSLTWEN